MSANFIQLIDQILNGLSNLRSVEGDREILHKRHVLLDHLRDIVENGSIRALHERLDLLQ